MGGAAFGRTPRRGRALPRPSGRKASLLPLFRRLTPRDLGIFDGLLEHRVLTIHQLLALFFDSASIARRRMLELFRLALVDRFHPPMVRSGPTHYVLDHLGARVLAAHRGIEFRELGWTKEDMEALPYRQEFRHLKATNDLIVHLVGACRANGAHRVTEWRGELWCQRAWAEMVFPDAYVQLQGPEGAVGVFVELDMGTESPSRLQAKLTRYEEAAQLDGCPDTLVFCFPTPEREIAARRRLWNPGLTLATGVFDSATREPLGDVWLPIDSQVRVPLLALRRGWDAGGSPPNEGVQG